MKTVKLKIGTYPKDKPKGEPEAVWYWWKARDEWDKCATDDLEDGDRWCYDLPHPEKTEQERLEHMTDEELRSKFLNTHILVAIEKLTRWQMIEELKARDEHSLKA